MSCGTRLKKEVLVRQGLRCFLCGLRLPLQMHRVEPDRRGGVYESGNVIAVCSECHLIVEGLSPGQIEALSPYGDTRGLQAR